MSENRAETVDAVRARIDGLYAAGQREEARAVLVPLVRGSAAPPALVALWLELAYRADALPATDAIDVRLAVLGLDDLIERGVLDAAAWAAPRLARAFPEQAYFVSLERAFARLPPTSGDPGFDAFRDVQGAEVQVVARAGADTTLLGFCGLAHRIGLPLNLMHRWLGRLGCHVVYLRDRSSRAFSLGVEALGADREETLAALRGVLAELGTRRTICFGVSAGGYGALSYGLELGAHAALCSGAPTNGDPAFLARLGDSAYGRHAARAAVVDLAPLYRSAPDPPWVHLTYGAEMPFDRAQAENMAGLPRVSLEPVAGVAEHNVIKDLVRSGRLDALLAWLASGREGPPAA